jgi:hypothetical protein
MGDAENVARLVNDIELAQIGMAVYTVAGLREEWGEHGDSLGSNVRIVEVGGRLAGYLDMQPDADGRNLYYEGYVAPGGWAAESVRS